MTVEALALILIAMLVGAGYPIQAGVNATLAGFHGHPLLAALTNTAVASTVLVIVIVSVPINAP